MIGIFDEDDYLPPRRSPTLMWPRVDDEEAYEEIFGLDDFDELEEVADYKDLDFIRQFPPQEE